MTLRLQVSNNISDRAVAFYATPSTSTSSIGDFYQGSVLQQIAEYGTVLNNYYFNEQVSLSDIDIQQLQKLMRIGVMASSGFHLWEHANPFINAFVTGFTLLLDNGSTVTLGTSNNPFGQSLSDSGINEMDNADYIDVYVLLGNNLVCATGISPEATLSITTVGLQVTDGYTFPWSKIDAFTLMDDCCYCSDSSKYWFFMNSLCWSKQQGASTLSPPDTISNNFSGLPNNLDAACYCDKSEYYWFFQGESCYSKQYEQDVVGPMTINSQFPNLSTDIDAACYDSDNNVYWFFKGTNCWSKPQGGSVSAQMDISETFRSLPVTAAIDSAVYCSETNTFWFFIKGNCWSLSEEYGVGGPFNILSQFPPVVGEQALEKGLL